MFVILHPLLLILLVMPKGLVECRNSGVHVQVQTGKQHQQGQTGYAPGPGSVQTGYAPGPGSVQTGYAPGPGSVQTGYAPGSAQTGYAPGSAQTGYAPGSAQTGWAPAQGPPSAQYQPALTGQQHQQVLPASSQLLPAKQPLQTSSGQAQSSKQGQAGGQGEIRNEFSVHPEMFHGKQTKDENGRLVFRDYQNRRVLVDANSKVVYDNNGHPVILDPASGNKPKFDEDARPKRDRYGILILDASERPSFYKDGEPDNPPPPVDTVTPELNDKKEHVKDERGILAYRDYKQRRVLVDLQNNVVRDNNGHLVVIDSYTGKPRFDMESRPKKDTYDLELYDDIGRPIFYANNEQAVKYELVDRNDTVVPQFNRDGSKVVVGGRSVFHDYKNRKVLVDATGRPVFDNNGHPVLLDPYIKDGARFDKDARPKRDKYGFLILNEFGRPSFFASDQPASNQQGPNTGQVSNAGAQQDFGGGNPPPPISSYDNNPLPFAEDEPLAPPAYNPPPPVSYDYQQPSAEDEPLAPPAYNPPPPMSYDYQLPPPSYNPLPPTGGNQLESFGGGGSYQPSEQGGGSYSSNSLTPGQKALVEETIDKLEEIIVNNTVTFLEQDSDKAEELAAAQAALGKGSSAWKGEVSSNGLTAGAGVLTLILLNMGL